MLALEELDVLFPELAVHQAVDQAVPGEQERLLRLRPPAFPSAHPSFGIPQVPLLLPDAQECKPPTAVT